MSKQFKSINMRDVFLSSNCVYCDQYKRFLCAIGGKKRLQNVLQRADYMQQQTGQRQKVYKCGLVYDNTFSHLTVYPDDLKVASCLYEGKDCICRIDS